MAQTFILNRKIHEVHAVLSETTKEYTFRWRFILDRDAIVVTTIETLAYVVENYRVDPRAPKQDTPTAIWDRGIILPRGAYWRKWGDIPASCTFIALFPPRAKVTKQEARILGPIPPIGSGERYSRIVPVTVDLRPLTDDEKQHSPPATLDKPHTERGRKSSENLDRNRPRGTSKTKAKAELRRKKMVALYNTLRVKHSEAKKTWIQEILMPAKLPKTRGYGIRTIQKVTKSLK